MEEPGQRAGPFVFPGPSSFRAYRVSGHIQGARSGAAAKLDDPPAVALGRSAFRQRRKPVHGLALFGSAEPCFAAGLSFPVKQLRHGSRAAHFAGGEYFNFKKAAFVLDSQPVARADFARRFGAKSVGLDAAQVAGARGKYPSLEEARGPKPLVHPDVAPGPGAAGGRLFGLGWRSHRSVAEIITRSLTCRLHHFHSGPGRQTAISGCMFRFPDIEESGIARCGHGDAPLPAGAVERGTDV